MFPGMVILLFLGLVDAVLIFLQFQTLHRPSLETLPGIDTFADIPEEVLKNVLSIVSDNCLN